MPSDLSQFTIIWLKSAHKSFNKLPISDQKAIIKKIDLLIISDKNLDIKKLKGHMTLYRLRVGDYRIVFSINKKSKQICIAAIGHRREIYKSIGH